MIRIVAISDTHLRQPGLPLGDVLIHAGDLCNFGTKQEFADGLDWLASQKHSYKFYVPGNHDRYTFDFVDTTSFMCSKVGVSQLVDKTIMLDGISFHGSPWTRIFGWTQAYMHDQYWMNAHWKRLPKCDVLITHSPPAGIFDQCPHLAGCEGLLDAVGRLKPRVHLFGHIHTGHGGIKEYKHLTGEETLFANVCALDASGMAVKYGPLIIDLFREHGKVQAEWLR